MVSRRGARLCSAWAPAVIECPLLGKGTPYAPGRSLVQQREPNLSGASSVPLGWGRRGSHGRRGALRAERVGIMESWQARLWSRIM